MQKPELVIGYLMKGGTFTNTIKVPQLLDWIKYFEPEDLITFFQDLLELIIQISKGKENVDTLAEFLGYWRELALETEREFSEDYTDPEEAGEEIAAQAADILWQSLAKSIEAAMGTGELGIFGNYDEAERELTSPWIDVVEEQPGQALTSHDTRMELEPMVDITEEQRDEYLALSIFAIPFGARIHNCFERENIETVRDLVRKTDVDLLMYENFGPGSLYKVKECLLDMGLSLGMNLDDEDHEEDEDIYDEDTE